MGRVYRFLGLTTGVIVPNLREDERRQAYAADITYATNNELGFDYLRDNMKYDRAQMVQRPFNFAIVDEVDSILIDEARTPHHIGSDRRQVRALHLGRRAREADRSRGQRELGRASGRERVCQYV